MATWAFVILLWFGNVGLNLLLNAPTRWVWLTINIVLGLLSAVVFKYTVIGLLWRKAEEDKAAEQRAADEAFFSIVMREHGRQ